MKKIASLLILLSILSWTLVAQEAAETIPKAVEAVPQATETVKETVKEVVETRPTSKEEAIKMAEEVAKKASKKPTAKEKKANLWRTLAKITFRKEYDEMMGFKIDVPVFSDAIEALAGKEVTIKGYIIPVEGYKGHKEFILSAFPYNMCFFCGGAGPETVMEVVAQTAIEYTAEAVTIKGKLELNDNDINRLMYSMVDAVLVEE